MSVNGDDSVVVLGDGGSMGNVRRKCDDSHESK